MCSDFYLFSLTFCFASLHLFILHFLDPSFPSFACLFFLPFPSAFPLTFFFFPPTSHYSSLLPSFLSAFFLLSFLPFLLLLPCLHSCLSSFFLAFFLFSLFPFLLPSIFHSSLPSFLSCSHRALFLVAFLPYII